MSDIVQKLWGFCHTLRHDGIDYGDYIEQITYLLFLKMADERGVELPEGLRLAHARDKRHRAHRPLHRRPPQARQDPRHPGRHLRRRPVPLQQPGQPEEAHQPDRRDRVDLPRRGREGRGLRGAAGEGGQRRQEGRRPVLHAPRPDPVHRPLHEDPTPEAPTSSPSATPPCGTGGFLVAAYEWLVGETKGGLDRDIAKRVKRRPTSARTSSPAPAAWP